MLFIDRDDPAPANSPEALKAYEHLLVLFDKWEERRHTKYGGVGIPYFGLNPRYLHDADEKPFSTSMDKGERVLMQWQATFLLHGAHFVVTSSIILPCM